MHMIVLAAALFLVFMMFFNNYSGYGESCKKGVHCKPGFCMVNGKFHSTYKGGKGYKFWDEHQDVTGTCQRRKNKDKK